MNDQGYMQYSEQGGGLSVIGSSVEQSTEERLSLYGCQELFPVEDDAAAILSAEQLRYVYGYYVRFLVPCLESRGYEVGTMPSSVEFYERGNLGLWNPYAFDITPDAAALVRVKSQCAAMPPGIADPYR